MSHYCTWNTTIYNIIPTSTWPHVTFHQISQDRISYFPNFDTTTHHNFPRNILSQYHSTTCHIIPNVTQSCHIIPIFRLPNFTFYHLSHQHLSNYSNCHTKIFQLLNDHILQCSNFKTKLWNIPIEGRPQVTLYNFHRIIFYIIPIDTTEYEIFTITPRPHFTFFQLSHDIKSHFSYCHTA